MQTIMRIADEASIALGAQYIKMGEVVAFPTETVYGLGANALNESAVRKIFEAKGRPADNPLIVHIAHERELEALVTNVQPCARRLMEAYWPGPMTLVMDRKPVVSDIVTAGLHTVGIRLPQSEIARALIEKSGCPIAAPSANRSGLPSPTRADRVLEDMDGRIPLIIDGGACQVGLESSVIDVTGECPIILRPGGITPEMVERVCGSVQIDEHVMKPLGEGDGVRSPGMKYKHYAPKAELVIYEGENGAVREAIIERFDRAEQGGQRVCIFSCEEQRYGDRRVYAWGSERHPELAAGALFEALRAMDDQGVQLILAQALDLQGIGLAVMNRMGRAAAFHIEHV